MVINFLKPLTISLIILVLHSVKYERSNKVTFISIFFISNITAALSEAPVLFVYGKNKRELLSLVAKYVYESGQIETEGTH